ncbi:neuropeptides capa receptor-like [Ornithodoros turicata]
MDLGLGNVTVREYLELHLGPQHILLPIVIPLTVIYVIIFVTGVIGNVTVCLVIARNSHFQTPTNYYLFSLAISDLLILVFGLPNDLKLYWQQYPWVLGEPLCKLRALIAEATSYASVLTIVAFTAERYVAIRYPLFLQTRPSSLSRAMKILAVAWIAAIASALPFALYTRVNFVDYPQGSGRTVPESAFCSLPMDSHDVSRPLLQFSTFAFFCLPMTIIVVLYLRIGLGLRESRVAAGKHGPPQGDDRRQGVRRSIHRMLVAVVIAFFLCWAPFHTQRLLAVYVSPASWTTGLRTLNEILYYTGGCLYYFSATINPILYSLMSVKYREAFREALCSFSKQKRVPEFDPGTRRFTGRPVTSFFDAIPITPTPTPLQASPVLGPYTLASQEAPVKDSISQLSPKRKFASLIYAVIGFSAATKRDNAADIKNGDVVIDISAVQCPCENGLCNGVVRMVNGVTDGDDVTPTKGETMV